MSNACFVIACDVYGPWRVAATLAPGVEAEVMLCDEHYELVRTPARGFLISEPKVEYSNFAVRTAPQCCCNWGAAVGDRGMKGTGEWPEFECDSCPVHLQGLGPTGHKCRRHKREETT